MMKVRKRMITVIRTGQLALMIVLAILRERRLRAGKGQERGQ